MNKKEIYMDLFFCSVLAIFLIVLGIINSMGRTRG
ncbi:unnamed protein product [Brassica oleracea]